MPRSVLSQKRDAVIKRLERQTAREAGLCGICCVGDPALGKRTCQKCLDRMKNYRDTHQERRAKYQKDAYQLRLSLGQCVRCGLPADGRSYCASCKANRYMTSTTKGLQLG